MQDFGKTFKIFGTGYVSNYVIELPNCINYTILFMKPKPIFVQISTKKTLESTKSSEDLERVFLENFEDS